MLRKFFKKKSTKGYNPPIKEKRKKEDSKKKLKAKFYLNIFATVSVIAFFLSLGFLMPHLIKIGKIVCYNQYGDCSEAVSNKLKISGVKSIYQLKREIAKVLSEEVMVSDYSLTFRFPAEIEVNVIERKINFALYSTEDKKYALIDAEGKVISTSDSSYLPFILINRKLPEVGDTVDEKTLFSLNIVFDLNSFHKIRTSYFDKSSLVIELEVGPEVIFPQEGDRDLLLGSINLILSRLNSLEDDFTIEGDKGDMVIDLRFNKPVIRFKD